MWDMTRPLQESATLEFLPFDDARAQVRGSIATVQASFAST